MPVSFSSLHEANIYYELIMRRLMHYVSASMVPSSEDEINGHYVLDEKEWNMNVSAVPFGFNKLGNYGQSLDSIILQRSISLCRSDKDNETFVQNSANRGITDPEFKRQRYAANDFVLISLESRVFFRAALSPFITLDSTPRDTNTKCT